MHDARAMAAATARALGIARRTRSLVCSTGVIGKPLPMERGRRGHRRRPPAALSRDGGAARRRRDPHDRRLGQDERGDRRADRRRGALGAMAQGRRDDPARHGDHDLTASRPTPSSSPACCSGCCAPPPTRSFNLVSVDGAQSTNDTRRRARERRERRDRERRRRRGLGARARPRCCSTSRKQMVADGEGSSRFAHYEVIGAADDAEARRPPCARSARTSSCAARCTAPTRTGAACWRRRHLRRRRSTPERIDRLGRRRAARRRRRRGRRRARRTRARRCAAAEVSVRIDLGAGRRHAPSCTRPLSRPSTCASTRSTRRDASCLKLGGIVRRCGCVRRSRARPREARALRRARRRRRRSAR